MLISLLVACATMHHGPEGVEGDLIASPEDVRLLMDGDLASEALQKSNGGKVPVTVTTRVQSRGQTSQTTVQVGYPSYGYGGYGPGVMYASASDQQLMQAANFSEGYRRQWAASNGMVPSSVPAVIVSGQGNSMSGVTLSNVVVTKAELAIACPSNGADGRAPQNAAEYLACQRDSDIYVRTHGKEVK